MKQPTELQIQAAAMTVIANLARTAHLAGATITPDWWVSKSGLVTATWHDQSGETDADALRSLDVWRGIVGTHKESTYVYDTAAGPRRVFQVSVTVDEVSIVLSAAVPVVSMERVAAGQQVAA